MLRNWAKHNHVLCQISQEICYNVKLSKFPLLFPRIYEMELRLDTPIKFRHPCYEALTWFAAKDYIKELKSYSEKGIPPPIYLLEGMKEMLYCFSMWTRSREVSILIPSPAITGPQSCTVVCYYMCKSVSCIIGTTLLIIFKMDVCHY